MHEQMLRDLCMALPLVEERLSHGAPTWFYKGKRALVMFVGEHHGARFGFWCAAPPGVQAMLIAADPETYFRPPYVGPSGWIGIYLDREVDWDDVAHHIEEAYGHVSRKR